MKLFTLPLALAVALFIATLGLATMSQAQVEISTCERISDAECSTMQEDAIRISRFASPNELSLEAGQPHGKFFELSIEGKPYVLLGNSKSLLVIVFIDGNRDMRSDLC
ncbi:hypothetical protein DI041_09260 [Stenotrophomonas maltophilia]|uniref:hypothetical protein n=1 Tax=Stenotrophomonas maltophilia TaxID=40324 RepID=UPI0010AA0131|nr:hypothetical protein [Stenotrophomonas maltophilia]TIE15864.1 hypothetical protein DI034_15480 [Stenotrophomonas maltophilia]TIE60990.1 hypothetical protein DI041_09260 [Stenotrophomonas maltophilia]